MTCLLDVSQKLFWRLTAGFVGVGHIYTLLHPHCGELQCSKILSSSTTALQCNDMTNVILVHILWHFLKSIHSPLHPHCGELQWSKLLSLYQLLHYSAIMWHRVILIHFLWHFSRSIHTPLHPHCGELQWSKYSFFVNYCITALQCNDMTFVILVLILWHFLRSIHTPLHPHCGELQWSKYSSIHQLLHYCITVQWYDMCYFGPHFVTLIKVHPYSTASTLL